MTLYNKEDVFVDGEIKKAGTAFNAIPKGLSSKVFTDKEAEITQANEVFGGNENNTPETPPNPEKDKKKN